MTKTGVFATEEEKNYLIGLTKLPYMIIGGHEPPNPQIECHRIALEHGLPEIEGYYGMMGCGEFVTV